MYNDLEQEAYDDGYDDAFCNFDMNDSGYRLYLKDAYRHGYQVGLDELVTRE